MTFSPSAVARTCLAALGGQLRMLKAQILHFGRTSTLKPVE
jgi:hypothetical protein